MNWGSLVCFPASNISCCIILPCAPINSFLFLLQKKNIPTKWCCHCYVSQCWWCECYISYRPKDYILMKYDQNTFSYILVCWELKKGTRFWECSTYSGGPSVVCLCPHDAACSAMFSNKPFYKCAQLCICLPYKIWKHFRIFCSIIRCIKV